MKTPGMNRSLALSLQVVTVLIGLGTLAFLLWEPHLEGRNAHATTFEIYFHDPFLAYVYVGSLPFFAALARAFGLFGQVRHNGTFSRATLNALHVIKRCALTLLGFIAGGVIIIFLFGDPDDRPAGFFLSLLVGMVATAIAITSAKFARHLQIALGLAEGNRA